MANHRVINGKNTLARIQEEFRHMPPELSRRIMKMIEALAATGYGSATEQLVVEGDQ